MAQRYFPVDLTIGSFPFLSTDKPRTVMVTSEGKLSGQSSAPAIIYGHNILPTDSGYESVGYTEVPSGLEDIGEVLGVKPVYGTDGNRYSLVFLSFGLVYYLDSHTSPISWAPVNNSIDAYDMEEITVADVQGLSYICTSGSAVYNYNAATNSFDEVALTGLEMSSVLGVIGSSGYLLAYTDKAVAWSSTINPTDFDPSDVTGAGGGNVSDTIGPILFGTSNAHGILLYTSGNIISGQYTGNSSYPFKLAPLESSGGGMSLGMTTEESNNDVQYAITTKGLQAITYAKADIVLPEAYDFLSGSVLEYYDNVNGQLVQENVPGLYVKLSMLNSRYLIASYKSSGSGNTNYPYALVYDTALNKLGKLKVEHIDVFELPSNVYLNGIRGITFISMEGTLNTPDMSTVTASDGVLIVGKLQYSHSRMFKLLGVEIENLKLLAE